MNNYEPRPVLGRVSPDEFFDRNNELAHIASFAMARSRRAVAAVVGAPRVGKSEVLRKSFDRLFADGSGVAPIYYALKPDRLDPDSFARDYLAQCLAQFLAFRAGDAGVIAAAAGPLSSISQMTSPEDYLWVRQMVESFQSSVQSGDWASLVRAALAAPATASAHTGLSLFVMLDNYHLLANPDAAGLRSEIAGVLTARDDLLGLSGDARPGAGYLICGLRRPILEMMPAEEEFFDRLQLIRVERMAEEALDQMIRSLASRLQIGISDSTTELMIHQLGGDLFYTRALVAAAASRASGLKTFMEFERLYTEEVLEGRIGQYLDAMLRDIAPDSRSRRVVLEALELIVGAGTAVPLEAIAERMGNTLPDGEVLLGRLHARELVEINFGFVLAGGDPVLADYVRARYHNEIAGGRRPLAGYELLGEKLKASYSLMMSRYNRAVESQLIELLSRFDFQSAPACLLDLTVFEERFGGLSRVQARRMLDEEKERIRLPQIVFVTDLGSGEQPGLSWRLFAATGFEGGIYSEANEVLWLIALINSKEPLDLETLGRIDQRLESLARGRIHPRKNLATSSLFGVKGSVGDDQRGRAWHGRTVRWYISKEGFSAAASARAGELSAHRSAYLQLDLLHDHLTKLSGEGSVVGPATEFELVIPIEDDTELIAARTVEQIARTADFDQQAINQIKTALIEACINAAEHSDSPDRRIYQRFALADDRLVITVWNKGKHFDPAYSDGAGSGPGRRGRGLQIIRALMDEVRFDRRDDGTSLVMTKLLKRSETQP